MQASGDRGCWASGQNQFPDTFSSFQSIAENQWAKKFPFITMRLEPGMGIVIPSGTYHSLTMPDGARILLNTFVMPKYKGLWDATAAKYSFYNRTKQNEKYAALRHLKSS